MTAYRTEEAVERYRGIDAWPGADALHAMLDVQRRAVASVEAAIPALAAAAEDAAVRMAEGGRLVYAGAGTSGLLAHLDALELPGTYGIPLDRVPVLLAGGASALVDIPGEAEDDADAARRGVDALGLGPQDALFAITASGRTPYAVAALEQAREAGALTIGVACNPGTPVLARADHAIVLETPPEVVAGSTRMGAGTAQKCALNLFSTLLAMRLGHVHDGQMVNMRADNAKLRRRAAAIVARIAGVDEAAASAAFAAAGDEIKTAVVMLAGSCGASQARRILRDHGGHVRAALAAVASGGAEASAQAP